MQKQILVLLVLLINCISINSSTAQDKEKQLTEEIDFALKSKEENTLILGRTLAYYYNKNDWENYTVCLNDKSALYYYSTEYHKFIVHADSVYGFAKKLINNNSQVFRTTIHNLSIASEMLGDYPKSIRLQKEALKDNEDDPHFAYYQESLGYTYLTVGDYDEAISYYKQAIKNLKGTRQEQLHAKSRILRQMAFCVKEEGRYEEAQKLYHDCLEILDELPALPFYLQTSWYANIDLSDLYLRQNQIDRALYYAGKAINLLGQTNELEAYKSYIAYGNALLSDNAFDPAVAAFQEALSLASTEYADFKKHPGFAICYTHLANAFQHLGDLDQAMDFYQRALHHVSPDFTCPEWATNPAPAQYTNKRTALDILQGKINTLWTIHQQKGNGLTTLEAAYQTSIAAADLIQAIHRDYLNDGSKLLLSNAALPIYEKGIAIALECHQKTDNPACLEQAFRFSENNKAVLLFESIRDHLAKGFAGIPDSLLEKESSLYAAYNYYQKHILESKQKKVPDAEEVIQGYEDKTYQLSRELHELADYFDVHFPGYQEWKETDPDVSPAAIRRTFPNGRTALLEYFTGTENTYLFCLTTNDLEVYPIPEPHLLTARINHLRGLIADPPASGSFAADRDAFVETAHALYQQLLSEPLQKLPPNINHLLFIPDDVLCYLPFEVLVRERPDLGNAGYSPKVVGYLLNGYHLSYQYAASLLPAETGTRGEDLEPFLGFAPGFSDAYAGTRACTGEVRNSLHCNQREVEGIRELFGGQSYTAEQASLDQFIAVAPTARILHLATHACVDDSDTGLNRIYLSDGDLTPYDLHHLRLQADLTVLSACNTGLGRLQRGEGLMSLTRSFLLAGSRSVLTSLWPVDDCATADIMMGYYRGLKKGLSQGEALSEAKRGYLSAADRNNQHPYYWGAFVQFGELEALEGGRGYSVYLVAGVLLLLLLLAWYGGWRQLYG